jgi:hypothetical protein
LRMCTITNEHLHKKRSFKAWRTKSLLAKRHAVRFGARKRKRCLEELELHSFHDTSCLENFLGVLQPMGLSPIGVHDLIQMGTTGLVFCHCPVYLSYAWCTHACAFVFDRGIISTYPTTMHPEASDTNKSKGRKKKARHGKALDIEG